MMTRDKGGNANKWIEEERVMRMPDGACGQTRLRRGFETFKQAEH